MRVYEIPAAYRMVFDESFVDDDGVVHFDQQTFDEIEDAATDKVANCGRVIREWKAQLEAMKAAKKSMEERIRSKEKQIEYLASLTIAAVQAIGHKVETPDIAVNTRASKAVRVNEELLGAEWWTEKVTKAPNKVAIKKAIDEGFEIEGAELVTNYSLSLK